MFNLHVDTGSSITWVNCESGRGKILVKVSVMLEFLRVS